MDRGRVGYDLMSNKFLRERHLEHVKKVHHDRIHKIKTREVTFYFNKLFNINNKLILISTH